MLLSTALVAGVVATAATLLVAVLLFLLLFFFLLFLLPAVADFLATGLRVDQPFENFRIAMVNDLRALPCSNWLMTRYEKGWIRFQKVRLRNLWCFDAIRNESKHNKTLSVCNLNVAETSQDWTCLWCSFYVAHSFHDKALTSTSLRALHLLQNGKERKVNRTSCAHSFAMMTFWWNWRLVRWRSFGLLLFVFVCVVCNFLRWDLTKARWPCQKALARSCWGFHHSTMGWAGGASSFCTLSLERVTEGRESSRTRSTAHLCKALEDKSTWRWS